MKDKKQDSIDSVLREHVADGIEEYDNPMPQWWVGLFYFTIVFAFAYLAYFHLLGGPSLTSVMDNELHQASVLKAEQIASDNKDSGASGSEVDLEALLAGAELIKEGEPIYKSNCIPCHGDKGQGGIGPNLTDEYWIHGGSAEDVIRIVTDGVAEKGMIAWGAILGSKKIQAVSAYVLSLQGTNPPDGKAPEGEKYDRK